MIWIVLYLIIGVGFATYAYKRRYYAVDREAPETYMIYAWITIGWLVILIVMFLGDRLGWWD